jgi:hypothetical protein
MTCFPAAILDSSAAHWSRLKKMVEAGRAFSVGSDLRQRKNMTKEQWLRQRG